VHHSSTSLACRSYQKVWAALCLPLHSDDGTHRFQVRAASPFLAGVS